MTEHMDPQSFLMYKNWIVLEYGHGFGEIVTLMPFVEVPIGISYSLWDNSNFKIQISFSKIFFDIYPIQIHKYVQRNKLKIIYRSLVYIAKD